MTFILIKMIILLFDYEHFRAFSNELELSVYALKFEIFCTILNVSKE